MWFWSSTSALSLAHTNTNLACSKGRWESVYIYTASVKGLIQPCWNLVKYFFESVILNSLSKVSRAKCVSSSLLSNLTTVFSFHSNNNNSSVQNHLTNPSQMLQRNHFNVKINSLSWGCVSKLLPAVFVLWIFILAVSSSWIEKDTCWLY